jgi:hypothetical protein
MQREVLDRMGIVSVIPVLDSVPEAADVEDAGHHWHG